MSTHRPTFNQKVGATMILKTEDVKKSFGGLVAVNDVSLTVNEGEIFGIIGPNGAGKTTFLNCISGYYKPEKGQVLFQNQEVTGYPSYKMCHLGMSRTFQITRSFSKMTAFENVKVGATFGSGKRHNINDRVHKLLEFVEFPLAPDTMVESLNTMQLKRLELARALATDCRLLLLDEVAAGLTPGELPAFIELIKRIRDSGVTIICIEHVMKFILCSCDRIAVLVFGEKIAEGSPEMIQNNKQVVEAYLGKTDVC